mmetsp:Transcript_110835/g.278621  ORF Transcript_110835/g.278621 Transcript_110835/m.278621 type:complete len:223 (+) Transcript_110835:38-706(+)
MYNCKKMPLLCNSYDVGSAAQELSAVSPNTTSTALLRLTFSHNPLPTCFTVPSACQRNWDWRFTHSPSHNRAARPKALTPLRHCLRMDMNFLKAGSPSCSNANTPGRSSLSATASALSAAAAGGLRAWQTKSETGLAVMTQTEAEFSSAMLKNLCVACSKMKTRPPWPNTLGICFASLGVSANCRPPASAVSSTWSDASATQPVSPRANRSCCSSNSLSSSV